MRSGTHHISRSNVDGSDPPATSLPSIMATQDLYAGHLMESGLYLISTPERTVRYISSIRNVAIFRLSLQETLRTAYLAGHVMARQSTSPPIARATGSVAPRSFARNEPQVTHHGGFAAFESYEACTMPRTVVELSEHLDDRFVASTCGPHRGVPQPASPS